MTKIGKAHCRGAAPSMRSGVNDQRGEVRAIARNRRFLTAINNQSIIGATLTFRAFERLEISLEMPIFPGFPLAASVRDFCGFGGVFELPGDKKGT
jgi:hypothetical protein